MGGWVGGWVGSWVVTNLGDHTITGKISGISGRLSCRQWQFVFGVKLRVCSCLTSCNLCEGVCFKLMSSWPRREKMWLGSWVVGR